MLESRNPRVREEAARKLLQSGESPDVMRELEQALGREGNSYVRQRLNDALSETKRRVVEHMGGPEGLEQSSTSELEAQWNDRDNIRANRERERRNRLSPPRSGERGAVRIRRSRRPL